MKFWNHIQKEKEWKLLQTHIKNKSTQGMLLLARSTNDIGIIHEIIEYLYHAKEWKTLDSLYLVFSRNQKIIRGYLKELYGSVCLQLQQEITKPMHEKERIYYAEQLDMMIGHTLCTKEETPEYGNLLTDLFIQVATPPALVNRTSLILTNYPEKQNDLKNALMKWNQLEYLYYYIKISSLDKKYIDISFIGYVLYQIDSLFHKGESSQQNRGMSYERLMEIYWYLQELVMEYNQQKIVEFEKKSKTMTIYEMVQEVSNPENPILSMVSLLPISEIERENVIASLDCNQKLKQNLILVFQNRNQQMEQVKQMDLYYVLYRNSILGENQYDGLEHIVIPKEKEAQKQKS